MPNIPFPNIPALPGVPPIPRSPAFPPAVAIGLGIVTTVLIAALQSQNQWGVYDSKGNALGNTNAFTAIPEYLLQIVGYDSTLSTNGVDYRKEMKSSDFPVERGGFASYNKVERPATPNVILCLAGSESDRASFLMQIDTAAKSTNLYNVVTPEVTYVNYSIDDYSYQRRAERGATLLLVELKLTEIREVSAAYSQTINAPQDVGATPQTNAGIVQPQTPNVSTLQSIATKIPSLASSANSFILNAVQ